MPIILVLVIVLVGSILLIPLSIILRFRTGTARRQARQWVATINLAGVTASVVVLMISALITSYWVPDTLTYAMVGIAAGAILGGIGLAFTRWETGARHVHYTPNPWIVLAITSVIALRLAYGLWHSWAAWRATPDSAASVAASGVAGSMSAGAVVLGYYLVFWAGIRRRLHRSRR